MPRSLPFLLALLFVSNIILAQNKYTISGYVEDKESGEKLIGANVYDANTFQGTTTNAYGFFSLTLPEGAVKLTASFIGYSSIEEELELTENISKNYALEPKVILDAVEITAEESGEKIHEKAQMSTVSIPIQQIKSLPAFLGEVDIIKALQLMPGVQSGSEASSGLYVRGGGPDQNLILLDGVPVYNASHLFGFFSVFNADAIKSVELTKGGFPARYGGRLSSVLDIRMKEGNMNKFGGAVSLGIISSKIALEGPILKGKTSFMLSGRRTYFDLLTRPIIKAVSETNNTVAGYFFHDFNAKINHKFSDKDRLYLSAYTGRDKFYFKDEQEYELANSDETISDSYNGGLGWGNLTGMVRWNHLFTPKLFGNLTLTYSNYDIETKFGFREENFSQQDGVTSTEFQAGYLSGIEDWAGKIDFDFHPNPANYIRFGAITTFHTFNPGAQELKLESSDSDFGEINLDSTYNNNPINAVELGVYVEDDIKIGSRLRANVGLHFSGFAVDDAFYKSLQPRLSARYSLLENLSVKASYAQMRQYIHLLSNSSALNLPSDLWVPATGNVKPQASQQVAAGVAYTLKDKYEFSIEGYYKTMDNLITYLDGVSFVDGSTGWDEKIGQGSGEAYGAEFLVQKKTGKTTGWIGYTLSWSTREFDERINNGLPFFYKYDRRHDVAIALVHRVSKRIELSSAWVFGTGNAVTLPIARYGKPEFPDRESFNYAYNSIFGWGDETKHYAGRNGFRMPNYHRLDVSCTFIKQKKTGERRWNIAAYNAYNRNNPFFLYEDREGEEVIDDNGNLTWQSKRVYKQVSIFPIIPSVSYSRTF